MKRIATLLSIALSAVLTVGCAALSWLNENDSIVRIGVAEYIAGDVVTAHRVIDFTRDGLEKLDGRQEVSVAHLQAEIDRSIPWATMRPGQRVIAEELLVVLERRFAEAIKDGKLDAEAVVDLRDLLATAERQAQRELALAQR